MANAKRRATGVDEAIRRSLLGRYPLLYLVTEEEERAEAIVTGAARGVLPGHDVWRWSVTSGLVGPDGPVDGSEDLRRALDAAAAAKGPALFLVRDPHPWLADHEVVRRLREIYTAFRGTDRYLVLLTPVYALPPELKKETAVVDMPPPGIAELEPVLGEALAEAKADGRLPKPLEPDERVGFLRALQGLTVNEARHVLAKVLAGRAMDATAIPALFEEKALLTRKEGILQFVPQSVRIEDVGGLENLKDWLAKRKKLFRDESLHATDLMPRGLLMMGVSGCGKSLSVKAISHYWDLPLFRLDLNQVFSGAFGTPEDAFARALRVSEALAPCILWIDEIEGGITGYESGSGGSTWRIFSTFLTWMQEKIAPVFVAATANRIDLLPAEVLRKGRFDQIFFLDLPSESDRGDIFRVHLQNREVDLAAFDLSILAKGTKGWNGAEIEQCVVSAMVEAYARDRGLVKEDLYDEMQKIVPLSTTMAEQIKAIRSWAHDRAVKAGT